MTPTTSSYYKANKDNTEISKENLYLHKSEQQMNTGVELDFLQKYYFVCIDIYNKLVDNESIKITTNIGAWIRFLGTDEPDNIVDLLEQYPEFISIYEELYKLCENVERVMNMYSEVLAELDKYAARASIEDFKKLLKEEADEKIREVREQTDQEIREMREHTDGEIREMREEVEKKKHELLMKNVGVKSV